jgi:hypothetical protein
MPFLLIKQLTNQKLNEGPALRGTPVGVSCSIKALLLKKPAAVI